MLVGGPGPSYLPAMRRTVGASVAVLALAMLVGCSGPGASSSSSDSGGAAAPAVAPGGAPDSEADRQIVTTPTASVTVKHPAAGAQRVSELVEAAGGRVDQRTEQAASGGSGDQGAVADLVVRVPADALTGLLADLEDVGKVTNVSVSHSDVTAKTTDLDARTSALQTSVTRLQGLMGQAASTQDLLAAEKALSERQADLESLQSERALLADQVELSTLAVHLQPSGVAPPGGPHGFLEGLGTGWKALLTTLAAFVVVLGILLPWLVVAGVVTGGVLVPLRRVRRRAAAKAPARQAALPPLLPPPPSAQPPPGPPAPPQA